MVAGAIGLFTKESVLPPALRALPYDVNSVMHFGEREYSKNGHRTIIIKSPNVRQNRIGLSANDVRKIEMVYGAECRARDRQEKIELCQSYPGVARRKRELDPSEWKSLRVNPDITPPTSPRPTTKLEEEKEDTQYITDNLKALGIEKESQAIIEEVYKVSALALQHAREKFCNISSNSTTVFDLKLEMPEKKRNNSSDLLGILEIIADYAKSMIDDAVSNIVVFCKNSDSIAKYQRQKIWCGGSDKRQCTKHYKPTKSGFVRQSTQHRPVYKQSTKHDGAIKQYSYDNSWRSGNATEISNSPTTSLSIPARRKREATETTTAKEKKVKEKKILKEKVKGQKEKEKEVKKDDAVAKTVKSANVTIKPVLNVTRRFFQEKRYKSWLL
ncbi:unnamed protein product [Chrysodeixis includens]|uniref:Peptidase M12A domain-containing protein n=1 Tax=Chrysodeixis includens TaxID=689277 RepID=A0A9N8KYY3_CHRIL|nr:unnamed protein product [Chrysodeixis includens]